MSWNIFDLTLLFIVRMIGHRVCVLKYAIFLYRIDERMIKIVSINREAFIGLYK